MRGIVDLDPMKIAIVAGALVDALRRGRALGRPIQFTGAEARSALLFAGVRVLKLFGLSRDEVLRVAGAFWDLSPTRAEVLEVAAVFTVGDPPVRLCRRQLEDYLLARGWERRFELVGLDQTRWRWTWPDRRHTWVTTGAGADDMRALVEQLAGFEQRTINEVVTAIGRTT